jgi:hypothetical protein
MTSRSSALEETRSSCWPRTKLLELLDGVEVDGAHGVEAAFDVGDDGFDEVPVGLAGHFAGDFDVVVLGGIDDHDGDVVLIGRFALVIDGDHGLATAAGLEGFLRGDG